MIDMVFTREFWTGLGGAIFGILVGMGIATWGHAEQPIVVTPMSVRGGALGSADLAAFCDSRGNLLYMLDTRRLAAPSVSLTVVPGGCR